MYLLHILDFYNCENCSEYGLSKLEIMDYTITQQLLKRLSDSTII
jgi:hypothetical protein